MFKKYLPLFIIFLFITGLFLPKNIFAAATVSITNYSSIITEGQNFDVGVSISNATDGTNYLRADLFKENTTNYFGETFNGSIWYGGSTGQSYLPVQITGGVGSGILQSRIGTPSASEYTGPGNYKLKVRRYYGQTGSSYIFSNTVDIQIVSESPTSSPSAMPSPSQSPTASPTIEPTNIPTQTPEPTPIQNPTNVPTVTPTATAMPTIIPTATPTPPTETQIPTAAPTQTSKPHNNDEREKHELKLPFGYICKIERHDYKFKKISFKFYKFHFKRS